VEYQCKMTSAAKLNVTPVGFVYPLCDTCRARDCTNPIENMSTSILGVVRKMRLYNRGTEPRIVIDCEGYIKK